MINHLRINLSHSDRSELQCFRYMVSQIFWNNPVRWSIIHKIDGVINKLSILLFIGYILYYKKMDISMTYAFMLIITRMIYFFILSNHYSTREWCCYKHIIYHGMSHILCFAGSLYAFLPGFYYK